MAAPETHQVHARSPQDLVAAFQRAAAVALPGGVVHRAPSPAEAQAAGAALERLFGAAEAAHPQLAVDEERFLAHVARHVPAAPADWADAIGRLHAADLYLAFACAEQVPGALPAFEAACAAGIDGALRGSFAPAFVEDVRQLLREKLFVGDGGAGAGEGDRAAAAAAANLGDGDREGDRAALPGPRILSYAGRGPLPAWVAVSARRTALSMSRHEASTRARHAAAGREELAAHVHPELAYLKVTYRAAFADAFKAAFAGVSDRERTLLRLNVLERLRLEQIAPMFQVNVSTVSRWLAAARESILERTRAELGQRLHISPAEFGSIARLVQSQVDVSLAGLLASGVAPGAPPAPGKR